MEGWAAEEGEWENGEGESAPLAAVSVGAAEASGIASRSPAGWVIERRRWAVAESGSDGEAMTGAASRWVMQTPEPHPHLEL